jgi:eukaryotic-like serine/threonine-protein kinase
MSQTRHSRIGALIRARREALGLTQAALAEKARLSVDTISNLERGVGANSAYWNTIGKLAEALELDPTSDEYALLVRLAREKAPGRVVRKDRRAWLIGQVRSIWIAGVLEQRLKDLAFIDLRLAPAADGSGVVPAALAAALAAPGARGVGPSVAELFEALGESLLLLGSPGSGKTITMLALMERLLLRAESERAYPIPMFLPLASWAGPQLPLARWLEDELARVYLLPRELYRHLLDARGVVLLLDGLDEVRPEQREACVAAIDRFRRDHGCRVLLSCRSRVMQALQPGVVIGPAVELQPLDDEQVRDVLAQAGSGLAAVRAALEREAPGHGPDGEGRGTLAELARSPLMLSIIMESYNGLASDELPAFGSPEAQRRHLLDSFLDRTLGRKDHAPFPEHRTRDALAWLAHQLQRNNQPLFFLDQLQPSWLNAREARHTYALLDRFGGAVLAGLLLALAYLAVIVAYGLLHRLGAAYWSGLLPDALLIGLVGALLGGLFGGLIERRSADDPEPHPQLRERVVGWVSGGLVLGLAGLAVTAEGPTALMCGLVGALAGALMGRPALGVRPIVLVEERRWSWRRTLHLLPVYLSAGVVVGTLIGLAVRRVDGLLGPLLPPIAASVVAGLLTGALASVIFGVTYRDDKAKADPNQGIWRSGRNALRSSLEGAVGGALFGALVMAGPISWLLTALIGGLLGALACGGGAIISHVALRLAIWRHTPFPLHGAHFLEHGAERGLLQRVGGGYQFVHPRAHGGDPGEQQDQPEAGPRGLRRQLRGKLAGFALLLVLWLGALLVTSHGVAPAPIRPTVLIDPTQPSYSGLVRSDMVVAPGDRVSVHATGTMAIGPWTRNVPPAGMERGGLGFPLGDVFKLDPAFPTGALLCRVEGEAAWRRCGPDAVFVAHSGGRLEFLVNDVTVERHEGGFAVAIEIAPGR